MESEREILERINDRLGCIQFMVFLILIYALWAVIDLEMINSAVRKIGRHLGAIEAEQPEKGER